MLNCTDLACVLHHHHFYAHLHHLKHHLDNSEHTGLGDGGSDVDNNDIQGLLNDTDAPDDVIYIVFGVIIAMLIAGVTIILVAVTISKIRKREDSSVVVSPVNVESPLPSHHHHHHHHHQNHQQYHQNIHQIQQNGQKTVAAAETTVVVGQQQQQQPQNSPWVFPPLPPQPNIYSYNQFSLDAMQANQDNKNGFKGLKRQLSGRFKRMISRKASEPPTPTIPPELKPQLKTIYVY